VVTLKLLMDCLVEVNRKIGNIEEHETLALKPCKDWHDYLVQRIDKLAAVRIHGFWYESQDPALKGKILF